MSDTDLLGFPHDHAAIAWNNWLAQHIGKANTEDFCKAFYPPLNALDAALKQLYTERWLDTAVGRQLDGIGSIVGVSRVVPAAVYLAFFGFASQISGRGFGVARMRHKREPFATANVLGDTEYRILLQLKIALNNGHGTAEEIETAYNKSLGVTDTYVVDMGNANARVYINDFITTADPRSQLLSYMIPKAAGVKLWPYFYDADHIFGFINQNNGYEGFDLGVLARRSESNIPPIPTVSAIWDDGGSIWDDGDSIWDEE